MQLEECRRWALQVAHNKVNEEEPNGEYDIIEDAAQEAVLNLIKQGWVQYGDGKDADIDREQKYSMLKTIDAYFKKRNERGYKVQLWQNSSDEMFGEILWGTPDPNMAD